MINNWWLIINNAKLPKRLCTNALVISRLYTNAKLGNCNLKPWPGSWFESWTLEIAAWNPDLDLGVNHETCKLQLEILTWILVRILKLRNCNLKPWASGNYFESNFNIQSNFTHYQKCPKWYREPSPMEDAENSSGHWCTNCLNHQVADSRN